MKRRWLVAAALTAACAGAGLMEWNVSWAAPAIGRWTGGAVEMGRLWVVPWRGLRAQDVKIRPPGAGRLHARTLVVRYRWFDVPRGRVAARWQAEHIRLDPGSWKIRRPAAVALLSEGPVMDVMHGTLAWGPRGVAVERLRFQGWTMRGAGGGVWGRGVLQWWIRGQASTALLETLGFHKTRGAWESFACRAAGPVRRPTVGFRSRFFSLTWTLNGGAS